MSGKRRGSISLEAALFLPLVLLLLFFLLSQIVAVTARIKLQGALARTAAELSLLSPAARLAEEAAGDILETPAASLDEGLQDVATVLAALFGDTAADLTLDVASTGLLGPWIVQRTREWLADDAGNAESWPDTISSLSACLDWRMGWQQLWICLTWQQRHLLGQKTCSVRQVIPLWTGCKRPEDSSGEAGPSLWQLDNFSRGQAFRSLLGGTLPYDFPVIAAFEQGEATAIKSVDLTRPTYQAAAAFEMQIGDFLDSLAAFQGADYNKGGQTIRIGAGQITSRRLLLVIPENGAQDWLTESLARLGARAGAANVRFEVVRSGISQADPGQS
ncbi:MAG: hypothetical protein PHG76_08940 [Eubacteriales bacterium]|nr:hypothetical protein [Eubacteriales bacterium]